MQQSMVKFENHFNNNITYVFQHKRTKYALNGCQLFTQDQAERVFERFEVDEQSCNDVIDSFARLNCDICVDQHNEIASHIDHYKYNNVFGDNFNNTAYYYINNENKFTKEVQTPELCEEMVNINPFVMALVENQTEDLCWLALKKDIQSFITIKKPTYEMQKYAVSTNGRLISRIEDQTDELCKLAVDNVASSIGLIKNQTHELCELAVKKDPTCLMYVLNQNLDLVQIAFDADVYYLIYATVATPEMIDAFLVEWAIDAVELQVKISREQFEKYKGENPQIAIVCEDVTDNELIDLLKHDDRCFIYIENPSNRVKKVAVSVCPFNIRWVDQTPQLSLIAVKRDPTLYKHIKVKTKKVTKAYNKRINRK